MNVQSKFFNVKIDNKLKRSTYIKSKKKTARRTFYDIRKRRSLSEQKQNLKQTKCINVKKTKDQQIKLKDKNNKKIRRRRRYKQNTNQVGTLFIEGVVQPLRFPFLLDGALTDDIKVTFEILLNLNSAEKTWTWTRQKQRVEG